jgi:alcohol dehydrogenase class IV
MNKREFVFSSSKQLIFGPGKLLELPRILENYGQNVLFIRYSDDYLCQKAEELLSSAKKKWRAYIVCDEPTVSSIEKINKSIHDFIPDVIVAFGGGSVIDTGKVISALLTNPGELMDYLEVVGKGKPLVNKSIPLIAIPTTAGTGSEVTRNAVIDVPERKVKVSLRSQFIQPEIALIDPELTLTLPVNASIYSGLDAFIQVIEPYVSIKSNRMTDLFCREGIQKAAVALPGVFLSGDDLNLRIEMSWVSLLGGLCLANAGLGAVHGFAGTIGGMFHAPHGAICASLLPSVMKGNLLALKQRGEEKSIFYSRYIEIFEIVTNNCDTSIQVGLDWFNSLIKQLKIPCLKDFGIQKNDFQMIIQQSKVASSMKANPVVLNDGELFAILEDAYSR